MNRIYIVLLACSLQSISLTTFAESNAEKSKNQEISTSIEKQSDFLLMKCDPFPECIIWQESDTLNKAVSELPKRNVYSEKKTTDSNKDKQN